MNEYAYKQLRKRNAKYEYLRGDCGAIQNLAEQDLLCVAHCDCKSLLCRIRFICVIDLVDIIYV